MSQKSLMDIISPIMIGPSSSHTAGAIRIGLLARNIYNKKISKVLFKLYNSYAKTGVGHGTDKGLLAGILGYKVDDTRIKNIFEIVKDIEYKFEFLEDLNRHPNSVDIVIDDEMKISAQSVGGGKIEITEINGFSLRLTGGYDTLVIVYKDKAGMISAVTEAIQKYNINIATLYCNRDEKGGKAMMCIELDEKPDDKLEKYVQSIADVYFTSTVGKLEL